jgi:hypothetical protein
MEVLYFIHENSCVSKDILLDKEEMAVFPLSGVEYTSDKLDHSGGAILWQAQAILRTLNNFCSIELTCMGNSRHGKSRSCK